MKGLGERTIVVSMTLAGATKKKPLSARRPLRQRGDGLDRWITLASNLSSPIQ
jgi:hypothetical protein